MTLQVFDVAYKLDTNTTCPGDPRGFQTCIRRIAALTQDSDITFVRHDLEQRGVDYKSISAKFIKPYRLEDPK
jgi:hypothetical protein